MTHFILPLPFKSFTRDLKMRNVHGVHLGRVSIHGSLRSIDQYSDVLLHHGCQKISPELEVNLEEATIASTTTVMHLTGHMKAFHTYAT